MNKSIFEKNYERDTTFALQEFFSKCLLGDNDWGLGRGNPYTPLYIHYFDGVNIQFFENKLGMRWFFDELNKKNNESKDFVGSIVANQRELLPVLESYWKKETISNTELEEYLKLARKAMCNLTLYFLSAMDERTSDEIKQLTVEIRKIDELGAKHDGFIRRVVGSRGYPPECANVLVAEELVNFPSQEVLHERMKGSVLVDGNELFVGNLIKYIKVHPELEFVGIQEGADTQISEVRGQVAQKGKVVGKVRIVKNRAQANLVEEGEVVVSPMTTPDFIVGMHKAAAFVTDEGGIVCHAAIVAREMKKPCIIGTKIGSQVFKDGDMVEVDADQGIVKIIERSRLNG